MKKLLRKLKPPTQAPLWQPPRTRLLTQGQWPDASARLIVEGAEGEWSFVGAEEYGRVYCLVQLVRYGSDPEHAPRSQARLSRVREVIS